MCIWLLINKEKKQLCYWAVTPIKFKVKLISERGGQNTKVVVVDGKL